MACVRLCLLSVGLKNRQYLSSLSSFVQSVHFVHENPMAEKTAPQSL